MGDCAVVEKWCPRCGLVLEAGAFVRELRASSGLSSWCRECIKQYKRERRKRLTEEQRERERQQRRASYRKFRDGHVAQMRERYMRTLDVMRPRIREKNLLSRYGMTVEQYERMYARQNGCCAICSDSFRAGVKRPHVDHDHERGVVRGLLCARCNSLVGFAQDDIGRLRNGIAYLRASVGTEGENAL